jgi:hypothetical protein
VFVDSAGGHGLLGQVVLGIDEHRRGKPLYHRRLQ